MSSTEGEAGMRNLSDKATYQGLEEDVAAVKHDISALTDQITDALNTFAGTAGKQARRGYRNARANVDSAIDEVSERGGAKKRYRDQQSESRHRRQRCQPQRRAGGIFEVIDHSLKHLQPRFSKYCQQSS